jgi:transcriptional regulator GlxA family with amidase domain
MNICMPVYDDVDMLDVTGPFEMFSWANIKVDLVTQKPGPIRFRNGFSFNVPDGFDTAGLCDALWVPGGDPPALAALMNDPKRVYLDFLIRQSKQTKWIASVCEGALLLAAAGLLDGYEATTHWSFTKCLKDIFHVKVVAGHPRFHLDRNRLTGGGISSGLDEALKLIELLLGTAAAQTAQQMTQYYPCPPVNSVIPDTPACPLPPIHIAPPHGATPAR